MDRAAKRLRIPLRRDLVPSMFDGSPFAVYQTASEAKPGMTVPGRHYA